jgi:hypothetical protein
MYVKERFELNEYTQDLLQDMEPPFGYNGFGEFIFYRTYSRNINGRQENWADCVTRYINGIMSIRKDWYIKNHIFWNEKDWQEYAQGLAIAGFKLHWSPPGRGLWACGTDFIYERGAMALYNCSYTELTNNLGDDVAWLMDCLMLGVGVGFSPLRNDNFKLKKPKGTYIFVIPDSREGWVESERLLIESYMYGSSKPVFIYDEIRGPGLPIKGFGGISSGPQPLKDLHLQTEINLERYLSDSFYDTVILKTDIANQVGACVVAGNTRRSAELGQLSIDDLVFKDLKDYEKYPEREAYGWMSNNSVDLIKRRHFERLGEIADRVIIRGEPGIKNLKNFPYGRIGKKDKVRKDIAKGANPCLSPTLSKVLTKEGIKTIGEINIGDKIWSECGWTTVINKWSTGINNIYKYTTTAGVFYSTKNHQIVSEYQKIEVQHALSIDILVGPNDNKETIFNYQDIMDGLVIGDGENKEGIILLNIGDNDHDYFDSGLNTYILRNYNSNKEYEVSTTLYPEELPRTFNREIPERFIKGSIKKVCSFLKGLYSANGSICGNRITLKASSFKVIESVQLMLSSIGIPSYYTTNKTTMVEFANGKYQCKESYDLNITDGRKIFAKSIGFIQKYKTEKLNELIENLYKSKFANKRSKGTYEIISTELVSEEETFDITVDNMLHTFWCNCYNISNCVEICLEHREVCNVDETFPTMCENVDEWYEACEYATFYTSTVALLPTHQPTTNAVIARNRRIGVGIIDVTGWMHEKSVSKVTKYLRKGYKIIRKLNKSLAIEAGVPESIRVTTVKPGGTIPKLAGKTSGLMYPNFQFMIRRVRVQRNHPIAEILKKANVPFEADYFSKNTDVFEFPLECGPSSPAEEISLWQQAMNLVLMQREWADNMVSNTLNFRPRWKLIKSFSLFEGSLDPHADAQNYITKHSHELDYEFFSDAIHTLIPNVFNTKYQVNIKYDNELNPIDIKFYHFDPRHEEDDIEPVLAAICPLIKSVALTPHSPKGAYKQQPEEGISKEEYERRKSLIKFIDWTLLNNSDGQDEKFCTADSCENSSF